MSDFSGKQGQIQVKGTIEIQGEWTKQGDERERKWSTNRSLKAHEKYHLRGWWKDVTRTLVSGTASIADMMHARRSCDGTKDGF